jgi:hypothetical protein
MRIVNEHHLYTDYIENINMPMKMGFFNVSAPGTLRFSLSQPNAQHTWDEAKATPPISVTLQETTNLSPLREAINALPADFGASAELAEVKSVNGENIQACILTFQSASICLKILATDFIFHLYQPDHADNTLRMRQPRDPNSYIQLSNHNHNGLIGVDVSPYVASNLAVIIDDSDEDEELVIIDPYTKAVNRESPVSVSELSFLNSPSISRGNHAISVSPFSEVANDEQNDRRADTPAPFIKRH